MEEETKDIAVVENNNLPMSPKQQIKLAEDVAEACKEIVRKKSLKIGDKRHVEVEGWQTIAVAHGCTLSARNVQKVEGGYSAVGEVRRISDGLVIAMGEGFVGDDEENWSERDTYAKRAMAQTRAMSRAGRSAFSYVVVMMGDDFSVTPAEEVPTGGFKNATTQTDRPNCPNCGVKLYQDKKEGGYFCWKNPPKNKNGCGKKFNEDLTEKGNTDDSKQKFFDFWKTLTSDTQAYLSPLSDKEKYDYIDKYGWDKRLIETAVEEEKREAGNE